VDVRENAGLRPFTLHPDYFAELAATAGDRVRFSGLFAGPGDTPEAPDTNSFRKGWFAAGPHARTAESRASAPWPRA
jgi:hypothetical protein